MEFGLLGPLLVRRDGLQVPVPQAKLRVVLAVLLLNAGKVVSLDDLAEALWGAAPPRTARVTMQNYVMRLRNALGDADGGRITTHPNGYSISVDAGELDVDGFCAHLAASETAARAGSWDTAASEAREGLCLWRGEPLADVNSDLLSAREAPRLAEMRLRALETRVDADLHAGRHGEVIPELRQLVSAHPLRERMHAQLMLALYRDGRQAEALTVYQRARQILIDELGTEPGNVLQDMQQRMLTADPALEAQGAEETARMATATGTATSPYRGLSAFRNGDAGLFFGRESATAQVLELMSACLDGAGLVVVSGVSGVGKSSLLHAGVLSRLAEAGLAAAPDAASWPRLVLAPGRAPLAELAVRLGPFVGTDAATVRGRLAADPADFALLARQAGQPRRGSMPDDDEQRRVLLVIDQCEQLFTLCDDPEERQAFVTALHAAVTGGPGLPPAALAVLVVRADFEARLADYPQLSAAVQDRFLLTAMTERQLRLAITGPAAAAGARVDGELVRVLLDEVRTHVTGSPPAGAPSRTIGAGVLPLLSHALDQAWRVRSGAVLTLADYERTGGIEGAVAASAQRAYDGLTPAQQETARQVFTRLTATSDDGTDTAARVSRAELAAGLDDDGARNVGVVLETFAAERLLTLDAGTVEISHEALLIAWPLLRDTWLADARADRVSRTRLRGTATEWAQAARDPSYLYRGSRLDAAASTATRISADPRHSPLSPAEKDFLHASQRASRRRRRTRQQLIALLLALVAGLAVVWVAALRAGQAATSQRDIADSRLLISEIEATGQTNATVAQLESIAAWSLNPSPQARAVMLAAAASPQIATITTDADEIDSLAVSPDGKILATGTATGPVRLWDLASRQRIGRPLGTGDVLGFGTDGTTVVTYAGAAQRWDVATGQRIGKPFAASTPGEPGLPILSPDGRTLAFASVVGTMQLWDVATGRRTGSSIGRAGAYWPVAFSPDGRILATGSADGGAKLWDVATGQVISSVPGNSVGLAAFSPDGTTLATYEGEGTARLWDVATGRPIGKPFTEATDYNGDLAPIAFSPVGNIVAIGSDDGTVHLLDGTSGQQIGEPFTGGGGVIAIAFSPDGKTLITGNQDGTVRLWEVAAATFRQIGIASASADAWASFGPGGKTLITDTGAARRWDVATGQEIGRPFAAPPRGDSLGAWDPADFSSSTPSQVAAVALSPDGKMLATGTDGTGSGPGAVQLWDVATGRQVGRPLPVTGGVAEWVTFTPDGKAVAAVSVNNNGNDGTVQVWDASTGRQVGKPFPVAESTSFTPVAFLPDGTTLALRENPGAVQPWDIATGKPAGRPLAARSDVIVWLALGLDGRALATIGQDGVKLWNVVTGQLTSSMSVPPGVDDATFSPDGEVLATVNGNSGAVQLWDVATGQQIGDPMGGTGSEVVAFSPDDKTLAITNADGTVQLWNVSYLTSPLAQLCSRVGGSISPAEWARYVPAGPAYRNACG